MPFIRSRYPKNWEEVSLHIRKRSMGRCECTGECGHPEGHAHSSGRCNARNHRLHPITKSKVVLTVAHLGTDTGNKHDKHDVRDENLKAMCQRCHLLFDLDDHIKNAKETRRRKFIAAGNQELPL